jgi:LytR cell envelope-related transcriptional attenuator
MDWLQLLTPSLAILALFAAAALVFQSIRHGRAIRRVEDRLSESGGSAASQAALDRIAQLQARAVVSQGNLPPPRRTVPVGVVGGIAVAVVALLGVGSWYLFIRDDGGGGARASQNARPPAVPTPSNNTVPDVVPPLPNKADYTVAVLNASGQEGAARLKIAPLVQASGYQIGVIDNATSQDITRSWVMYAPGQKAVAQNVAKDLQITRVTPVDGAVAPNIEGSDVVVIVGKDLANRP